MEEEDFGLEKVELVEEEDVVGVSEVRAADDMGVEKEGFLHLVLGGARRVMSAKL